MVRVLTGPCLVVGKSTGPVGTAVQVRDRLRALAPAGAAVQLAWTPEFLPEGHTIEDSLRPDRLVFGVESDEADQTLPRCMPPLLSAGRRCVRTDLATAELAKVASNVMLAARISW